MTPAFTPGQTAVVTVDRPLSSDLRKGDRVTVLPTPDWARATFGDEYVFVTTDAAPRRPAPTFGWGVRPADLAAEEDDLMALVEATREAPSVTRPPLKMGDRVAVAFPAYAPWGEGTGPVYFGTETEGEIVGIYALDLEGSLDLPGFVVRAEGDDGFAFSQTVATPYLTRIEPAPWRPEVGDVVDVRWSETFPEHAAGGGATGVWDGHATVVRLTEATDGVLVTVRPLTGVFAGVTGGFPLSAVHPIAE